MEERVRQEIDEKWDNLNISREAYELLQEFIQLDDWTHWGLATVLVEWSPVDAEEIAEIIRMVLAEKQGKQSAELEK